MHIHWHAFDPRYIGTWQTSKSRALPHWFLGFWNFSQSPQEASKRPSTTYAIKPPRCGPHCTLVDEQTASITGHRYWSLCFFYILFFGVFVFTHVDKLQLWWYIFAKYKRGSPRRYSCAGWFRCQQKTPCSVSRAWASLDLLGCRPFLVDGLVIIYILIWASF